VLLFSSTTSELASSSWEVLEEEGIIENSEKDWEEEICGVKVPDKKKK
jgi:hypothetical protein